MILVAVVPVLKVFLLTVVVIVLVEDATIVAVLSNHSPYSSNNLSGVDGCWCWLELH